MYYRTMGKPHSIEKKRIKQRNQKRRKRHRLKQSTQSSGDEQNEGSTSYSSDQLTPEEDLLSSPNDNEQGAEATDSGLFEALDRVCKESDDYWEKMTEEKIREFDSYRDTHPCIVTDKERAIRVYVDGTGKYKNSIHLRSGIFICRIL